MGEQIDVGRLLGDEDGLALGEDDTPVTSSIRSVIAAAKPIATNGS